MSEAEKTYIKSFDGYSLPVLIYDSPDAKACIQIIHGMAEHKERYIPFAKYLSENGFNVILPDLRGHGEEAPLLSHIADKKGEELLIKDQQIITGYIKDRFKGLPLYLFGHSMGSIITRVLLQTDSKEYPKTVLCGYVCPNPLCSVAKVLTNVIKAFKKPTGHSGLLTFLALGPYINSVKDRKTHCDWLSYNTDNVKRYIEDPLSGVEFTVGSYDALFRLLDKMGKSSGYRDVNKDMKLLLISGRDDPCAGGEKGRTSSRGVLESAGFKDISVITYDNMRHEILNEKDNDRVFKDVLDFFSE